MKRQNRNPRVTNNRKPKLKELIEHIKRVAIEDFRLFFEPFVTVFHFIRSVTKAAFRWIKRQRRKQNEGGDK